jgi:hypothetical protein
MTEMHGWHGGYIIVASLASTLAALFQGISVWLGTQMMVMVAA